MIKESEYISLKCIYLKIFDINTIKFELFAKEFSF
jgi:hypothetical protein